MSADVLSSATLPVGQDLPPASPALSMPTATTLRDLLEDGIYLLFMLRDGHAPSSFGEFNARIDSFFASYDKQAQHLGKSSEQVRNCQYAFCALMDEIALSPRFPLHSEWARNPLQLRLFGEHLAGKGFFDRLEVLRRDPVANIEVLEVFYTCLLLGFQGKYLFEGTEKLDYLTTGVGQEIRRIRGFSADFAPNWKLPHRFQEYIHHELPMWLYFALLSALAAGGFVIYRVLLSGQINRFLGM